MVKARSLRRSQLLRPPSPPHATARLTRGRAGQVHVNGEPVMTVAGKGEGVTHHAGGRLQSSGRYTSSNITGLTHVDFVALPARARLSVTYQGDDDAEGPARPAPSLLLPYPCPYCTLTPSARPAPALRSERVGRPRPPPRGRALRRVVCRLHGSQEALSLS